MGLLETLVAAGVLLLLVGMQVVLIRGAASAFHKANTQADLLQDLQIAATRLNRDAQGASPLGTSLNANGVSLCSAHQQSQVMQLGPTGQLLWREYLLYSYAPASKQLYWKKLAMTAPIDPPVPIELYNFGSGLQPLSSYQTGGKLLVSDLEQFQVTLVNNELSCYLKASRLHYGSNRPEVVEVRQSTAMRN